MAVRQVDVVSGRGRIQRGPSLAAKVHDSLLGLLIDGAIGPGERLVIERIAADLGVSPTPVREALARLVQEGLAHEGPAGRLYAVSLSEQYVRDTFLVRGALEGLCAELAAPRIAAEQIAALRAQASVAVGAEAFIRLDTALHAALIDAASNQVLASELRALGPHIDLIRGYSQRNNGAHLRESYREHLLIIAALEQRDTQAARQHMEQHIRSASERIVGLTDFRDG